MAGVDRFRPGRTYSTSIGIRELEVVSAQHLVVVAGREEVTIFARRVKNRVPTAGEMRGDGCDFLIGQRVQIKED